MNPFAWLIGAFIGEVITVICQYKSGKLAGKYHDSELYDEGLTLAEYSFYKFGVAMMFWVIFCFTLYFFWMII